METEDYQDSGKGKTKGRQTMNGAQDEECFQSLFNMRINLANTVGPNPFVVSTATPNEA